MSLETNGIEAKKCICGESKSYCRANCNFHWRAAFTQGYACCVANIIRSHGESTETREAFRDGIGTIAQAIKYKVDEHDLELLKQYFS